ncbi:MAG TPA: glycosyltransferase [Gemmataceae bacterium]|jgi:UDP:flavonoid glycosyltransferase YjiC (YdhE family)|nr:glycosyltransferase [Gemmataceae bacterium]
MRAIVIGIGYRGDVQPLVGLAAGLRAAGYSVTVATHDEFAPLVKEAGLGFHLLPGQVAQFIGGPAGAVLRDRISDRARFPSFAQSYMYGFLADLLDAVWAACRNADMVFGWPLTRMLPTLAEGLGVPCFVVAPYPVPYFPTRAFPNPFENDRPPPEPPAGKTRHTWLRGRVAFGTFAQPVLDAWRGRLGLAPMPWQVERRRLRRLPHLLGYSPWVLPRPDDWPANVHCTGYWVHPIRPDYRPHAELEKFLADGPQPVVFSFSSQVSKRTAVLTDAVLGAVERTGQRAVLLAGWGGLRVRRLPPGVLQVPAAPHDWLFPQAKAVVHHGGSGTTAAALLAGVPSAAVAFGYDQPLWGTRLARLGVGPEPIPVSEVTLDRLTDMVSDLVSNPARWNSAARAAAVLRAEDGVGNAVALVRDYLTRA